MIDMGDDGDIAYRLAQNKVSFIRDSARAQPLKGGRTAIKRSFDASKKADCRTLRQSSVYQVTRLGIGAGVLQLGEKSSSDRNLDLHCLGG
jgi:hypothetical protein